MDGDASFGRWLHQRRRALDLTQDDLGRCVGCSADHIRNIEADRRRPSKEIAERFVACLNIAPDAAPAFIRFARGESSANPPPLPPRLVQSEPIPQRSSMSTMLPAPSTALIGRTREVATLCEMLSGATIRLLTLTGPPGTGKTRLSIDVAARLQDTFADGVCFVSLALIRDPALAPLTIAQALGVRIAGSQPPDETLKLFLHDKHLLLLLDNFEHLLPSAALVVELLAAAPRLAVLVTSRELLRLSGEHAFPVPPLSLPERIRAGQRRPSTDGVIQSEAVKLFVARAQAANPDFQLSPVSVPVVAEICQRLDGLPLAIELAAVHSKLLPPQALLARLERCLPLLTRGARDLPIRQQTLRSTIDWSYGLLDPDEQTLFARLGIFAGGCTLEAAEAVCGVNSKPTAPVPCSLSPVPSVLDGLQSLLDKSLLRQWVAADGEPRVGMLETLREYALDQLEQRGEREAIQRRHAGFFLRLMEQADPELRGPRQDTWLERLEQDHDNLRGVLRWALEAGEVELGLRMAGALGYFWYVHGHYMEGRRWLEAFLHHADALPAAMRAKALNSAGLQADGQNDLVAARAFAEEALALRRTTGDKWEIAFALRNLGEVLRDQGEYRQAAAVDAESLALFRELADKRGIVAALTGIGSIAVREGRPAEALAALTEGLELCRELEDKFRMGDIVENLGHVAMLQGDYVTARLHYQDYQSFSQAIGDRQGIAVALLNLALVSLNQGDPHAASTRLEESLALLRELGDTAGAITCVETLAELAAAYIRTGHVTQAPAVPPFSAPLPPAPYAHYAPATAAARLEGEKLEKTGASRPEDSPSSDPVSREGAVTRHSHDRSSIAA